MSTTTATTLATVNSRVISMEITSEHTDKLVATAIEVATDLLGAGNVLDQPVRHWVEAFADTILEDWADLDTDERIDEVCNLGSHVVTLLAADQLLGTLDYGTEAGLYDDED